MPSATINLFLTTGDPQKLRVAGISNWDGKAIAAPRTDLTALLKREELTFPGVYLLTDEAKDTGQPTAYIGEAEVIKERLPKHSDKDWTQAFVFVAASLMKSHFKFLEGEIIEEAHRIGRFAINQNASGAKLPEFARADMQNFLQNVRLLLPVLGCDLLVPATKSTASQELVCKIKGLTARGQRSPQGFVVLNGSEASPEMRPSALARAPWLISLREKLLQSKILAKEGGRLVFAQDYQFSSPSAAAAVIRGGHANGLTAWRSTDGKTLKELEASI